VIASRVAGIPEQIRAAALPGIEGDTSLTAATGVLVPAASAGQLARAIEEFFALPDNARRQLGANAAADAAARFSLDREVDAYLDWMREIVGHR
jgi:glycosyltransferase involved in cell wall biosynthesis